MSNQPGSSPDPSTVKTLIMKGGGVKGLAFAGAIEVLVEEGFHFDTFVGTSAGSVGAVLLAAGYSPAQLQSVLREAVVCRVSRCDLPGEDLELRDPRRHVPGAKAATVGGTVVASTV